MTKRHGLHPDKELTAVKVHQTTKPSRYSDGNGLYLVVSNTGAKRWLLRIVVQGRRRDMGLGSVALVGLAEAREKAVLYRKLAREGKDPIEVRKQQQTSVPTFAEATNKVFEQARSTWKNEKHAQQWITTLETYAVPIIGNMRVDHVKPADILRVLSPIWLVKAETARRVRQRLKMVFDWTRTAGFTTGENPVVGIGRGLPKHTNKPKHHAAMPYADVPAFVAQLQSEGSRGAIARRAFEVLILTATRTSETLNATWSEVDFDTGIWTISANRTKAGREHRIPITSRTNQIFTELKKMQLDSPLVFPGTRGDRPMSNMVFGATLKRMKVPYTAHGF